MLGSMKGQARVGFSKSKSAPISLTGAYEERGSGVVETELSGKYYSVRDDVYASPLPEFDAALVAQPISEHDGWGVMYFKWDGGDGQMEWFDDKPEFVDEWVSRQN